MILSESEKNRIKGLYGLVTEADASAPPPDESVLVAKKNPFNDEQFFKFIKNYSSKMKDGDTFMVFDDSNLKSYLLKQVNQNLIGKELRMQGRGDDKIKKFDTNFTDLSMNTDMLDYMDYVNNSKGQLNQKGFNNIKNSFPFFSIYTPIQDKFRWSIDNYANNNPSKILIDGLDPLNISYSYHTGNPNYPGTSWSSLDESNKKITDFLIPLISYGSLPNEFFELRQIKRRETDF